MRHKYTRDQLDFIRSIAIGRGIEEITALVNERFGLNLTDGQIRACKKNHNIASGLTGRFEKGQVSWNKGCRFNAGGKSAQTRFRPGNTPKNHKPVGSERINVDGYLEVKVAEPRKWRMKHVILWEAHHGQPPQGQVIVFCDQDRMNVSIENLMLVGRSELLTMNRKRLFYDGDAESTRSGALIAKVLTTAADRKKQSATGGRR